MSTYACTATTQGHGRCRHNAAEGDQNNFCTQHGNERDSGKTVEFAVDPDKVLFKAKINERAAQSLTVRLVKPDFEQREADHVAHAEEHGREAHSIRKNIADSGVPIFGKDEGVKDALVAEALNTMLVRYRVTDIHMFPDRKKPYMFVLVVTLEKGVDGDRKIDLPVDVAKFFAMSSWGYAHIWANPPKDGQVIQTVNLSHRSDEAAKWSLQFADGLWAVEPCETGE